VVALLFLGFFGWPAILLFFHLNAPLADVGVEPPHSAFSAAGYYYSIKVIWAPVVEPLKLPILEQAAGSGALDCCLAR